MALLAISPAFAPFIRAADTPAQDKDRTGGYEASYTERSPLSSAKIISKTLKSNIPHPKATLDEYWNYAKDYDLSKDAFDVYVAANYTRGKPAGIFFWCSPGEGGLPGDWKKVADANNLIIATAKKAGNNRKPAWHRVGLALDAVHNLRQRYAVDPTRIFVGGLSGGGGIASGLAAFHPELFTGAMICGAPIPLRAIKGKNGIGASWDVSPGLFSKIKSRQRYVYITGEKDEIAPPALVTNIVTSGVAKWGFAKKPFYFVMPGAGHVTPNAEVFGRVIRAFAGEFDKNEGNELP